MLNGQVGLDQQNDKATAAAQNQLLDKSEPRDPLYLFMCHLEWRDRQSVKAYEELIAALDDSSEAIRVVAEHLLSHRYSPRPKGSSRLPEDDTGTDELW